MPNVPASSIAAATEAIRREFRVDLDRPGAPEADALARVALEAAAPLLAEEIAQKITAHMEGFGPKRPAGALEPATAIGRDYRAWLRHFGIAARIAAVAFYGRDDQLRLAMEAMERGDYMACVIPEVPREAGEEEGP